MGNEFLSGFVSIIGSPNVGKSTLMNAFVGQKVAIISKRPQTTRNRIQGVMTRDDMQIIFIDTPGIHTPRNRLGEYMVRVAYEALDEVECALFMVDATIGIKQRDEAILERLSKAKSPVVAAINKIDAANEFQLESARKRLGQESWLSGVVEISAEKQAGLDILEKKLRTYMIPGPKYFPDDMITDQPERILCAEMVREQALELLDEEVPHGIGVDIDKMQVREDQSLADIWATIYCERESHKGIIIGKQGAMLKKIGSKSRVEMEWMLGMRVNIQLWVKVKEDWRNKQSLIRMFGYE